MNRSIIIDRPFSAGLPDLGVAFPGTVVERVPGLIWEVVECDLCQLTMRWLGSISGGKERFGAAGSENILDALSGISSDVELIIDAWDDADKKAWLLAAGVEEFEGYPIAPHIFSGDNEIAMGKDEG